MSGKSFLVLALPAINRSRHMKNKILMVDLATFTLVLAIIMLASAPHVTCAVEYFSDGFESGDFSAWNSTVAFGATLAVISTSPQSAHNGTYFANVSGLDTLHDDGSARYLMTAVSSLYIRVYVLFEDLFTNSSGYVIVGPRFRNSTFMIDSGRSNGAMAISILNFNGTHRQWGVRHFVGGGWTNYLESGTSTVVADQWYCVEMELVISNTAGHMHLWVDGVQKVSQSNLDTDDRGSIDTASFGVYVDYNEPSARTVYFDDFIAGVFDREFLPTDLNKDGVVNIIDMAKVGKAFGCKPGDLNWNPTADVAEPYGVVNIVDVAKVAKDFHIH